MWIFTLLWMSSMFQNLDTGVIPTCMKPIMEELKITQGETAFMASIIFMACGITSFFVSPVMARFNAKTVIIVCEVFNSLSCLLFLYSSDYYWLLFARIIQGCAQAFLVTYSPVWINTFAPKSKVTKWISYQQSLSMIGIIAGYIVGSLAADAEMLGIEKHWNWRRAIFTQGIALFIIAIAFSFFPND